MYNNNVNNPNYQEVYQQAKHRVMVRLSLFIHFVIFLSANVLAYYFMARGYMADIPGYVWIWPVAWLIGLIFHWWAVSLYLGKTSSRRGSINLMDRLVEQELDKMDVPVPPSPGQWSSSSDFRVNPGWPDRG